MNKKQKLHQSINPGAGIGVKVVDKDVPFAIRQWKKKLKESGVLQSVKENQEFIKPSIKRREEIKKARYMEQKQRLQEEDL